MIDARHYIANEVLKNGLALCIRASRPDDIERIVEAFNKLDPEEVYLRFFSYKTEISAAERQRFHETDFEKRVILLATIVQEGREIVVASASYVRDGEAAAEVAFLVAEPFYRLGIGGLLLRHLGRIARANGITTFVAEVMSQNTGMLGVFKHTGWPMVAKLAGGTVHLELTLSGD